MKDIVARFDVEKAITQAKCMTHFKCMDLEELIIVLEAGLVHLEPESKKDTIEIDRAVAEEWMIVQGKTLEQCQIQHIKFVAAVKKALSEGRT